MTPKRRIERLEAALSRRAEVLALYEAEGDEAAARAEAKLRRLSEAMTPARRAECVEAVERHFPSWEAFVALVRSDTPAAPRGWMPPGASLAECFAALLGPDTITEDRDDDAR